MAVIKITKSNVDKMHLNAGQSQVLFFDSDMKGFGILVSQKTKTYVAQRDVKGKSVRVTLGRHGVLTTPQARAWHSRFWPKWRLVKIPTKKRS